MSHESRRFAGIVCAQIDQVQRSTDCRSNRCSIPFAASIAAVIAVGSSIYAVPVASAIPGPSTASVTSAIAESSVRSGVVRSEPIPPQAEMPVSPSLPGMPPNLTKSVKGSVEKQDAERIAELTAPYASPTPPGPNATLVDVEKEAAVSKEITSLLADASDARGLFGVGLDAVAEKAVLPYEVGGSAWAPAMSANLMYGYLSALHAEFSGGEVPEHWKTYFDAAKESKVSSDRVAMMGYNAHLTVDLAKAVADSGATEANYPEFVHIVGLIADQAGAIIDQTRATYGVDMLPIWHAFDAAPGQERLTRDVTGVTDNGGLVTGMGPQLGRDQTVRITDQAYSSISFFNGLQMRNPQNRGLIKVQIETQWSTVHAATLAV